MFFTEINKARQYAIQKQHLRFYLRISQNMIYLIGRFGRKKLISDAALKYQTMNFTPTKFPVVLHQPSFLLHKTALQYSIV